jgi:SpoIID/LytB domain protein
MGQYGALGYASAPYNWNAGQILGHYYGGTKLVTVANRNINVDLTELAGAGAIEVASASGKPLSITGATTQTFASPHIVSRGTVNFLIGTTDGSDVIVYSAAFPSGHRYFQGQILMAHAPAVVWNVVPLEDYVDGVVPRESPASWPAAALEAQAVAARSYALADLADSGAPAICDTTACQVYGGDPTQYGPESATFYQQSDAAVAATAYDVLECYTDTACGASAQIALTEFSSSTGGYSAGGTFPAVPDLGDATPSNPNHVWTAALTPAQIQGAFPSVGTLESVTVTGRNGLGDLGGRVTQIVLTGTAGQVTITGDQFAAAMGLRSDWFAFTVSISGMSMSPDGGGYWGVATNGGVYTFGDAKFYGSARTYSPPAPTVGLAVDPKTGGYWEVLSNGGIYSFNAPFYGSARTYSPPAPTVGLAVDPKTGGYWEVLSNGGIYSFNAPFFGSARTYSPPAPIIGMVVTPDGGGYWEFLSNGGIYSFGDARFYGSARTYSPPAPVVGMAVDPSTGGYWEVLSNGGIYSFNAPFYGSARGATSTPIVGIASVASGGGYLLPTSGGVIYKYGSAPYYGDPLNTYD